MDSAVVGIRENGYNWLSYGIVGNSVCRTWESCTLAFPCAVNRVIHDSIACYAPLRADSPMRSSSRPYSTFASSDTPL